ncbi:MAG: dockerin type I repeat-containing protein, partial [Oscillospiraceae bacterium]|nr:dockerin type I repeat-containing protein [Oscillospiraceae bacterium]
DGELTTVDAVVLQKWLLGTGELTCWQNVDLCKDGKIDVFDFCLLKKELINMGTMKKMLTFDELIKIVMNGEMTWSDFESYQSEDIGSGLYILKYEITDEDGVYLYLSGESMEEKPQEIYLKSDDGKYTDLLKFEDLVFPEVSESNTFDFVSPDGSQHFYVRQIAEKYRNQDGFTNLDFYTEFDHYDLLEFLTITSSDKPYMPFNSNGKWSENSFTDNENFEVIWNESSVTFNFVADKEYSLTFDYVDTSVRNQTITQEINNKEKPEITAVDLTADCAGGLKYKSKIQDAYQKDVMTSGTVGLVGTPIEFTLNETVESASAVFHYNDDELRWVKEEDLILMYYSNEATIQSFREVESVIDTEKNTVSFDVKNDGIYLLVDAYEWSNYFGKDRTEFKKEANVLAYISDWERGYYTGDIMNLCDKEWAIANAPDFKVSTPEQLASVVWYVNASGFQCSITLENDIDLAGYQWVSMGYQPMSFVGNPFKGTIDGNGFAIKNMSIEADLSDAGFIGVGGSEISNIRFENAYIKGGRNVGIVCGSSNQAKFSNVSVSGNIETHKSNFIGAIVGYKRNGAIVNCTADVTLCGEPYPHFSHQDKVIAETEIEETHMISIDDDCVLTRNDCGYDSLAWDFYVDEERILSRSAEKSTECNIKSIEFFKKYSGKECTVYLTTFKNGAYVRTSNILKFIIP